MYFVLVTATFEMTNGRCFEVLGLDLLRVIPDSCAARVDRLSAVFIESSGSLGIVGANNKASSSGRVATVEKELEAVMPTI